MTNFAFSPEQFDKIKNAMTIEIDEERSDVFCIGIFILCSILQKPFKNFYNYSTYEVNFEKIFKKVVKLGNKGFSYEFTDLLVWMIKENPEERPSTKTLNDRIQRLLQIPRDSILN